MADFSKSLIMIIAKKVADPSVGKVTRTAAMVALPVIAIGTGAVVVAQAIKNRKKKHN